MLYMLDVADVPTMPEQEDLEELLLSSAELILEPDPESHKVPTGGNQSQKRKGGRKPVCLSRGADIIPHVV